MNNEPRFPISHVSSWQVRDVLKGTLKPASVFNDEEIAIEENHYADGYASSPHTGQWEHKLHVYVSYNS